MTPAEREHVDGLPIWECPCVECLHLDYEAGEQIETFYDFARRERADRLDDDGFQVFILDGPADLLGAFRQMGGE